MFMKTSLRFLSVLILSVFFGGFAYANMGSNTAYEHMLEVNAQWRNYPDAVADISIKFSCDNDRIQYHLQLVEKHLRNHTPQNISASALKNRMQLLDVLHQYHETAIFPTNTGHANRQPYFIDDYGVYCAVGYLISKSGHDALAQEIHQKQNYAYIKEITVDGVAEWASEYGFTINELAWIQPGYMASTSFAPLDGGTNAPVDNMFQNGNAIIFTGDFSQVNGSPCLHIGEYRNGQLDCLGNGIDGTVNDVGFRYNNTVLDTYVAGQFESSGVSYPIAFYHEGSGWDYIAMPSIPDATAKVMRMAGNGWYVVISYPALVGKQEIWYLSNNNTWTKEATVNGVVKDIEGYIDGHVFVGTFNSVTVHGNGNVVIPTTNIIVKSSDSNNWEALTTNLISDNVLVVKPIGNALYFGGTCSTTGNDVCLTRYYNETFQPLVSTSSLGNPNTNSIQTIELFDNSSLIVGGEFLVNGLMYYGQNLALYDLTYNYIMPYSVLNGKVTGVGRDANSWYVGGHFTENLGTENLNHLAKITSTTFSIDEPDAAQVVSLYPNPAADYVTVETKKKISTLSIIDISGKEVMKFATDNNQEKYQLDISTLKPGIYVMLAEHAEGSRSQTKFLVN